jgi:hypothetical protein
LNTNAPSEFETARSFLFRSSVNITSAPATTPPASSLTDPVTAPASPICIAEGPSPGRLKRTPTYRESANNDSVVLKLQFRERSILMTGDIERKAEDALLAAVPDLRADVVKVPHHGSKTSSTEAFVAATRPRFAIISVGQDSMFGHPHAEVIERWKRAGAQVLTTGKCGTISVNTDGKDLWLKGMQSRTCP